MEPKPLSQEDRVLRMLETGPKLTHDFCSAPGLAAEYRRAISTLRIKLRLKGKDIVAKKFNRGNWSYRLVDSVQKDLFA